MDSLFFSRRTAREFEIVFVLFFESENQNKHHIRNFRKLIHQTLRRFDIYVNENQQKEIGALENELGIAANHTRKS